MLCFSQPGYNIGPLGAHRTCQQDYGCWLDQAGGHRAAWEWGLKWLGQWPQSNRNRSNLLLLEVNSRLPESKKMLLLGNKYLPASIEMLQIQSRIIFEVPWLVSFRCDSNRHCLRYARERSNLCITVRESALASWPFYFGGLVKESAQAFWFLSCLFNPKDCPWVGPEQKDRHSTK